MNCDVNVLLGKTLKSIEVNDSYKNEILFTTDDGFKYLMYHEQYCCEDVAIDDIIGDLCDLIGLPIIMAEEVFNNGFNEYGTYTWTFYKFATNKSYVTIRWYGESNGYYSESVDFKQIDNDEYLENNTDTTLVRYE